jgi:hypothetical protein
VTNDGIRVLVDYCGEINEIPSQGYEHDAQIVNQTLGDSHEIVDGIQSFGNPNAFQVGR